MDIDKSATRRIEALLRDKDADLRLDETCERDDMVSPQAVRVTTESADIGYFGKSHQTKVCIYEFEALLTTADGTLSVKNPDSAPFKGFWRCVARLRKRILDDALPPKKRVRKNAKGDATCPESPLPKKPE